MRVFDPIRRGLLALSLLLAIVPAWAQTPPTARPKVIGYVVDAPTLPAIDASQLDVINFAFAKVDEQHAIYLPGDTASASLATLARLKQDNPDLRIVLSVGGWGAGNFSEAAATAEARVRFTASALQLVREHRLDGVDIDWEYPTLPGPGISHAPADRDNFSLMLESLRTGLDQLGREHGRHYLLTIAAADGEAARGLDLPRIVRVLDWINLMTYDFHGSLTATTGHHAGLHASASAAVDGRSTEGAVKEFLAAGVPAAKLNVGAAFYGRMFVGVDPRNDGLDQPYAKHAAFLAWRDIQRDYLGQPGYVRHWDGRAQAAWLWNAQTRTFISYEDPQAVLAKAHYVREHGLGGVMYWEHAQDDGSLLRAVRQGLFPGVDSP